MKTNLTLLFLLVMMVSCQPKKSDSIEMSVAEAAKIDSIENCAADTVKATAIFWIDKVETKHCKEYGFRTIKAKVLIRKDGKVDLLSFVKKQSRRQNIPGENGKRHQMLPYLQLRKRKESVRSARPQKKETMEIR